jgi:predicted alpha/beta-hydrolase family hydrolase
VTADSRTWTVDVAPALTTTAVYEPAAVPTGVVFVCAHGAGGHMADGAVLAVTAALRAIGIDTVRFNFLYREQQQRRPDQMPRLVECWRAVVNRVRAELSPSRLVLGGRSMGGRAASVFVSGGGDGDALLLLAYPLHPPAQPHRLRVGHLAPIGVPVLCINGTRDPFCTPALMQRTLDGLGSNWRMHWLEGADHSFHVLKRSGRTDDDVLAEVAAEVARWVASWG